LVAGQLCLLPFLSALPLAPVVFFPMLVLWSIVSWSIMSPQQVRLIGLDPTNASVLLALNAAAIYVGAAIGSAVGSVVIARFGIDALGIASALCMAGAGLHLWATRRG
jgi:predicted MFS family arabinose efflux permease